MTKMIQATPCLVIPNHYNLT